jgi:hypothetical protein
MAVLTRTTSHQPSALPEHQPGHALPRELAGPPYLQVLTDRQLRRSLHPSSCSPIRGLPPDPPSGAARPGCGFSCCQASIGAAARRRMAW